MRFHWDENRPVLLTKEGKPVPLTVINDVPFYEFSKDGASHLLTVTPIDIPLTSTDTSPAADANAVSNDAVTPPVTPLVTNVLVQMLFQKNVC